ncbi:MAG: DUF2971 domain-containing protein [Prosthecobacter sp.]|nr:DUF2971 domain-containing protein [Prosthecobacter sp.]
MRLASPLAFNDPFELTPRLEKPSDDLLLNRLNASHLVEDYVSMEQSRRAISRDEAQREYFACELPKRFLNLTSDQGWSKKEQQMKWDYVGKIAERFRLLCCSHRHDSILMWSHYAEKHRGMVIEFDPDLFMPGVCLSKHALDVVYRSSPPTIPALHLEPAGFELALNVMLSTKALEWSYEEEVRILFPAPEGLKNTDPFDQVFDPMCIKRIIVGCYDHPDLGLYSAIDRMAEAPDFKHIHFQRAFLDSQDYKLRFADRER